MFALRRAAPRTVFCSSVVPVARASFTTSLRYNVKVGDAIPSVELMEGSPGNKVDLSKELADTKGLIIGVPAAYSTFLLETLYRI